MEIGISEGTITLISKHSKAHFYLCQKKKKKKNHLFFEEICSLTSEYLGTLCKDFKSESSLEN